MRVHALKTWPGPFDDVRDGTKRFEVRKYDRDFRPGDVLHLEEFDPATKGGYTGQSVLVPIVRLVDDTPPSPLPEGVCVLGLGSVLYFGRSDPARSRGGA